LEGGLRTRGAEKHSSSEMPLISVVTVVYNGDRYLEQTILSVINQTYENIEYVIVDGGSSDGTLDIIRKYEERIDYWVSEPDKGIYDAMNKGIDLSRGELINLLNADDFFEPDAIATVVSKYKDDRSHGVIYCNNYVLQEDLSIKYRLYPSMKYWLGMTVYHQTMFVHEDIYKTIGKYNPNYRFAADYDFFLRAIKNNIKFIYVDRFLVNYRNTGLTSQNYTTSIREGKKIYKTNFGIFSINWLKYLAMYYKAILLYYLQIMIGSIFGKLVLNKIKTIYLKKVIAKNYEHI